MTEFFLCLLVLFGLFLVQQVVKTLRMGLKRSFDRKYGGYRSSRHRDQQLTTMKRRFLKLAANDVRAKPEIV